MLITSKMNKIENQKTHENASMLWNSDGMFKDDSDDIDDVDNDDDIVDTVRLWYYQQGCWHYVSSMMLTKLKIETWTLRLTPISKPNGSKNTKYSK